MVKETETVLHLFRLLLFPSEWTISRALLASSAEFCLQTVHTRSPAMSSPEQIPAFVEHERVQHLLPGSYAANAQARVTGSGEGEDMHSLMLKAWSNDSRSVLVLVSPP